MAPFGLVPLDVVGHCTEDARHVAAPERVVGGSDHFYALLSHERPLPSVAGGQRSETYTGATRKPLSRLLGDI